MANFLDDTRVEVIADHPDRYRAELSPNWAVWGPNGGYLAAIALRAAMAHSRTARPVTFYCHFLSLGEFAPVELRVTSLGGGKRAESLRVEMTQHERLLLTAGVWMATDGLQGYEHDFGAPPDVPGPHALRGYQDLAGEEYEQWYPIWRSIEGRPLRWREPPGQPEWRAWMRFNETAIPDRQADALRQLFWLDFPGWNALTAAHAWPFRFLAPNLDLSVQFHRFVADATWMLADGVALLAEDGLVGCVSRLWSEDGKLLATGTSQHIHRPNPNYEQELQRARDLRFLPPEDR
jgi:acyl-CoA thioesterase